MRPSWWIWKSQAVLGWEPVLWIPQGCSSFFALLVILVGPEKNCISHPDPECFRITTGGVAQAASTYIGFYPLSSRLSNVHPMCGISVAVCPEGIRPHSLSFPSFAYVTTNNAHYSKRSSHLQHGRPNEARVGAGTAVSWNGCGPPRRK